jgi:hypothetical protein
MIDAGEGGQNYGRAKEFIMTSSESPNANSGFPHPLDPKSQLIGVQLGRALRLSEPA